MLKRKLSFMLAGITLFAAMTFASQAQTSAATKTYSITPKSSPYKGNYKKAAAYNSATKHYFLIRSYLELLEKNGGGKLILKKGTYNVTNVLYVPSKVTIELKDGVTIKKTMKTNTSKMKASGGLFELLEPSKSKKKGVHGKYNGVHDVKIYSTGKAVINQDYQGTDSQNCLGFVMCHNQNITISGITFKNMKYGHFIEMDASKNVNINNCTFSNLEKAIGTHQYSVEKYHTGISISNCTIKNCVNGAIEMMNWKKVSLTKTSFTNIGKDSNGKYTSYNKSKTIRAILVRGGVSNISMKDCTFKNLPRVMQCMPWKNENTAKKYPIIYNKITKDEYNAIVKQNKIISGVDAPYIIVNTHYNDYSYPDKYYF